MSDEQPQAEMATSDPLVILLTNVVDDVDELERQISFLERSPGMTTTFDSNEFGVRIIELVKRIRGLEKKDG